MPDNNELLKTLLSKATSMKADPYAQWFSDHPILGALASLVSPAVDPHREMGPADLVYTGLPFAAATGGVAKAGAKMYKGIKSGPSTAIDKYGLEDKMSRRGLFDRMAGNNNERITRDLDHVEGALNHLEDKEWGTYDPDTNPYGWIDEPNEGPDAYGTRMYSPEEKKLLDKHSELYNIHEMIGEKLGWPGKTTILDRLKGELGINQDIAKYERSIYRQPDLVDRHGEVIRFGSEPQDPEGAVGKLFELLQNRLGVKVNPEAPPAPEGEAPQPVTSAIDSLMRRLGVRK